MTDYTKIDIDLLKIELKDELLKNAKQMLIDIIKYLSLQLEFASLLLSLN